MTGFAIFLLIIVFFWICWPRISRWLQRKAMNRMEDYFRASMGMPPREKKKYGRKGNTRYEDKSNGKREGYSHKGASTTNGGEPIIPKEYAVDVEFTETIDYSESIDKQTGARKVVYHESQISDVEWTEIKESRS